MASANTSQTNTGGFNPLQSIMETATKLFTDTLKLMPDGIIMASAFFALVTLSFPYAIFFGSMVEAGFLYRAIAYLVGFLNAAPPLAAAGADAACRSGFSTQDLNTISMFKGPSGGSYGFPSAPLFMLATAASYVFGTLQQQSKELEALGPAYSSRYYISFFALTSLLLLFLFFRIRTGCEGVGSILLTIPVAFLVGGLLVIQNRRLFGEESINLLGIPLLRNRAANGKRLYLCATQVK
jgi:hypothetical protein